MIPRTTSAGVPGREYERLGNRIVHYMWATKTGHPDVGHTPGVISRVLPIPKQILASMKGGDTTDNRQKAVTRRLQHLKKAGLVWCDRSWWFLTMDGVFLAEKVQLVLHKRRRRRS